MYVGIEQGSRQWCVCTVSQGVRACNCASSAAAGVRSREEIALMPYISSKSLVCRWYLSLGLVQSRTISLIVLPVLTLFGRSFKTHLPMRLSANESACFESVQTGREAFPVLLILASVQPPFSFSPCNVNRRTPLRRALWILSDSSCGSHVPRSQSMMGPVSCTPSNSRFDLL